MRQLVGGADFKLQKVVTGRRPSCYAASSVHCSLRLIDITFHLALWMVSTSSTEPSTWRVNQIPQPTSQKSVIILSRATSFVEFTNQIFIRRANSRRSARLPRSARIGLHMERWFRWESRIKSKENRQHKFRSRWYKWRQKLNRNSSFLLTIGRSKRVSCYSSILLLFCHRQTQKAQEHQKTNNLRHLIFHFSSAHDWNFSAFDASGQSSNNNNKKEKAEIRGYLNDSFQSCFRPIATGKRAKRGISCLEVSTATGVRNPLQPKHRPRLDDLNESGIFSLFLFIFQVICWCVLLFSLKSRANCYC